MRQVRAHFIKASPCHLPRRNLVVTREGLEGVGENVDDSNPGSVDSEVPAVHTDKIRTFRHGPYWTQQKHEFLARLLPRHALEDETRATLDRTHLLKSSQASRTPDPAHGDRSAIQVQGSAPAC